ncbi:MAG: NAD(+)/NADH kinase [Cellulosilyticaceae bacterium]
MKNIGIIPNILRDQELETTKIVVAWLKKHDFCVYTTAHIQQLLNEGDIQGLPEEELYTICDLIVAIGGDGTLLGICHQAAVCNVPIMGINLGRLGFLADIEAIEVDTLFDKLLEEEPQIEERMMLRCRVIDPEGKEYTYYGLNDVNVTRGSNSRITEYEISVNQHYLDIYPADGIVVSTPTGSTAYNLSAGGPIVMPHAKSIIITPICPHTIYSRSVIVSDEDCIQIKTHNDDGSRLELAIDGQTVLCVGPYHAIEIEKSSYTTKLIKLSDKHFFDILRKKIVERRK